MVESQKTDSEAILEDIKKKALEREDVLKSQLEKVKKDLATVAYREDAPLNTNICCERREAWDSERIGKIL